MTTTSLWLKEIRDDLPRARFGGRAEVVGIDPVQSPVRPSLDRSPERVLALVADAATTADELAQALGESAHTVAAALVELELLGLVEGVDGVYRASP